MSVPDTPRIAASFLTKEEYVCRYLREQIVSGQLVPGTRIGQQQLADELGVSPTPVREALRVLVAEGWLTAVPHVGASVAAMNVEGLDEVWAIRELLEGYLAAEAARRMTPELMERLRALNDEFIAAVGKRDFVEARRLNYELHLMIWEAAESPVALGMVHGLWAKFPWNALGRVEGRGERTIDEHAVLLDALTDRDPERSRNALVDHISSGRRDHERLRGAQAAGEPGVRLVRT